MITREKILKANLRGLLDTSGFESWYTGVYQAAYNLGQAGINLSEQSDLTGHRYGSVPYSGLSINYQTGRSEGGLSLAVRPDGNEVGSAIWFADRPRVTVTGLLLPMTGSDGEALVLPYGGEDLD